MRTSVIIFLLLFFSVTTKAERLVYSFIGENNHEYQLWLEGDVFHYYDLLLGDTVVNISDSLNATNPLLVYKGYFRGGVDNEGLDLNYLEFTYDRVKYVLFDEYSMVDDVHRIGIRIYTTDEVLEIYAKRDTIEGSLRDVREITME